MQRSISQTVILTGVGIHSGQHCLMQIAPAEANSGITFIRSDLDNARIKMQASNLACVNRCTQLEENEAIIRTPEHFLSACSGLGIDNLTVTMDSEEVPILDGSALPFLSALKAAKPVDVGEAIAPLIIDTPIKITDGDAKIEILPADKAQFTYHLSYPETFIGEQSATFTPGEHLYENAVAPARTYGFYDEVKDLLEAGLAQGGSIENAVIIKGEGYMGPLRFPDELARHKLLDLMGDFFVLGRPILGHVVSYRGGHALSAKAVLALLST